MPEGYPRKAFAIGLVIPSLNRGTPGGEVLADWSFMAAMQGIEQALYNSRYRPNLIFGNNHYWEQQEYLRLFDEKTLDGPLIWRLARHDDYLQEPQGKPVVQLNSHVDRAGNAGRVEFDHRRGDFLVAEALPRAARHGLWTCSG